MDEYSVEGHVYRAGDVVMVRWWHLGKVSWNRGVVIPRPDPADATPNFVVVLPNLNLEVNGPHWFHADNIHPL